MGIWEVEFVCHVVDVQLHGDIFGDIDIQGGIYAGVAGQDCTVAIVDEALVLVGEPQTQTHPGQDLICGPQREHMLRQLSRSQTSRTLSIHLLTVQITVARGKRPAVVYLPLNLCLKPFNGGVDDI